MKKQLATATAEKVSVNWPKLRANWLFETQFTESISNWQTKTESKGTEL